MTFFVLLPNPQVLKLKDYASTGSTWEATEGEFPMLESLPIEFSDLKYLIMGLVLDECRRLRKIPDGIGEISTVELIEVKGKAEMSLVN